MILTAKQIEEIEHWASHHFALSRNDVLNLLETVKALQTRDRASRELLEAAMYYARHTPTCPSRACDCGLPELEQQIEEHLK